ncbi:MAG TPA: SUMF1/EgtB/PvdO family nonheme iron enzyme [Gemmataceae bacterium]|nr:SUMF1/EgtB/PvdO family nonheme iron enzyme [Gemmataceae bacterium]
MALLAQVVRLCAKYGSAARFAVRQVLNFCPGGVALADTVDAVLESAEDKTKKLDESWWKRDVEQRLGLGEQEQRRLSEMLEVVQTQMSELLQLAAEWCELPQQIETLALDALRRHAPLRDALRRVETLTLEMPALRQRVDELCRGQEEMRPLFERAMRFSACVEELEKEGLTPSLVRWLRGMRAAEHELSGGRCREAERGFIAQAAERPTSTAAAVGCAAAQSAGHKFVDAEQSLSRVLALQGGRADPELVELHKSVTVHSHGGPTPVTPPQAAPVRRPGEGDMLGGWRLEKFLARGGLGQVFLATHGQERGALKILHPELSQRPGFEALFKQEMRALMRLDPHPHLVSILDADRDPVFGCLFFVMPYVQGVTLERFLADKGALSETAARRAFAGLADGLARAHERGVQHRDIKPANIIVQEDGNAVLIDWGLSGLAGVAGHTQTAGYTALFAAPETFRTGRPDPDGKSDVYCLAASLYFALLHGEPSRRTTFKAKWVPEGLRALLERALDNDPAERPTVREFLQALSEAHPPRQERRAGDMEKVSLGGGVEMRFAWCPPGTFLMGSPPGEEGREPHPGDDESQHRVTLSRGFHLGIYPVTRGQFARFVEASGYRTQAEREGGAHYWTGTEWKLDPAKNWRSPGFQQTDDHPVVCISWNDSVAFCEWLTTQMRNGGRCRLPLEAEWEYACRAGTTTPFSFGETINTDQANYDGNYTYGTGKKGGFRQQTTPAGRFPPNAWGLYDLHGNVWEWCQDWYGPYLKGDIKDPQGAISGDARVLRGGSWYFNPLGCRAAHRVRVAPATRNDTGGCRVVLCLD